MSRSLPLVARSEPQGDLCVTRVPLFSGLAHDEQLEVAQVAHPTSVERAQLIYSAGSGISQLMVVHAGRVKISRSNAAGQEHLMRVLGPGDFIGESSFLTGVRPDHDATALEATRLCVFRHEDLGRLIEKHPSIGLRMLRQVSQRLSDTEARLAAVVSSDLDARLAGYLLSLPARHVEQGALEVTLPLAKKDIAALLDTTPESFSRQLRRLGTAGLITQLPRGGIRLLDVDRLDALAEGG